MPEIEDSYLEDIEHDGDFRAAPNGDFQLIKGKENLKQQLLHRLITVPGTIVHRPLYGVGVQNFQNVVGNLANQQALARTIKRQFEEDFRVNKVNSIKITNKDNGLFILEYSVEGKGLGTITDEIDPFGDLSF